VHGAAAVAIRAYAAGAAASPLALPIEIEAQNVEWQATEIAQPELAAERRFVAEAPEAALAHGREPELHAGRTGLRERRTIDAQQPALGKATEVTRESESGVAQQPSAPSPAPEARFMGPEQLGLVFRTRF